MSFRAILQQSSTDIFVFQHRDAAAEFGRKLNVLHEFSLQIRCYAQRVLLFAPDINGHPLAFQTSASRDAVRSSFAVVMDSC